MMGMEVEYTALNMGVLVVLAVTVAIVVIVKLVEEIN